MKRVRSLVQRVELHVIDRQTLVVISVAFALGIFLLSWQSSFLRLEIEGANIAWMALVAFGMAWHAGWGSGARVGAGLIFGAAAALGGFYGSLSILPATKLGVGIGLGFTALAVAALSHVLQRTLSFAAGAVGFGVGVAAARALPLRPTTPVDELFTAIFAVVFSVLVGVFGSLVLRALVVRTGSGLPHGTKLAAFDAGHLLEGVKRTAAKASTTPNGRKPTVKAGRTR